jgi:hypothetical protein
MEGLPSHKQVLLLINSLHVSAQIGHHQAILEEYTNDDGLHINYDASSNFYLKYSNKTNAYRVLRVIRPNFNQQECHTSTAVDV